MSLLRYGFKRQIHAGSGCLSSPVYRRQVSGAASCVARASGHPRQWLATKHMYSGMAPRGQKELNVAAASYGPTFPQGLAVSHRGAVA